MAETSNIAELAPGVRTAAVTSVGTAAADGLARGAGVASGATVTSAPVGAAESAAAPAQVSVPAAVEGSTDAVAPDQAAPATVANTASAPTSAPAAIEGSATDAEPATASTEFPSLTPQQKSRALNELFSATFDSVLRIEEHALDNRLTAGLTIAELHTIAAIEVHGRKTMSAIAARLHVTLATVTTAVNKLEKKGYVERQRNPEDRRQVLVSLTGKGRRACRVHSMFHEKMVARALSSMDDAQTDALASALQHLVDFFNEEDAIATESLKRRQANSGKRGSAPPPNAA